jgi:VIT1/CCC1 family predicted Fe2+/Mn2+ transporter
VTIAIRRLYVLVTLMLLLSIVLYFINLHTAATIAIVVVLGLSVALLGAIVGRYIYERRR